MKTQTLKPKTQAYIFDLDGTLTANSGHYHDGSDWDSDICSMIAVDVYKPLFKAKSVDASFIIITSRLDKYREQTQGWLRDYDIGFDALHMRSEGNEMHNQEFKEKVLWKLRKDFDRLIVFEDRQRVAEHLRGLGFTVVDVAGHKF